VAHALHEDEWITKLAIDATTSIDHLTQFVQLWAHIQRVILGVDVDHLKAHRQCAIFDSFRIQVAIF
jgi:hypothetical protein